MYGSSPLRSALNTGYITGLDMCKVCTEAVHSIALWTRVTLQVWTCVKYVRKQSIAQRFEHVCKCKRMSSSPPHPTLSHVMCARVSLGGKMMQNCACVHLWLQSVCAGDSGKWLCAHVTPACVRGWLWVEKMMQNCACVYLWLQSVCAGDPLTVCITTERFAQPLQGNFFPVERWAVAGDLAPVEGGRFDFEGFRVESKRSEETVTR